MTDEQLDNPQDKPESSCPTKELEAQLHESEMIPA
jgi:hypothetical protein